MCPTPASDRVLHAASSLFYRRGIRAVGVDTVVSDAGVAKMTLYKHFPSKDDLIVAVLDQQGKVWRAWFEAAVRDRARDDRGRLLALFDILGEWLAREDFGGCAFINAAVELHEPAHPAAQQVRDHKAWLRAFVLGLAQGAGLTEPTATADALLLLIEGAIVSAQIGVVATPAATARGLAALLIEAKSAPHAAKEPQP